ncbi:hypothetical protein ACKKBG_A22700 [Auxenochlorella protothecoides x Auxenochlorella symbiontica]
MLHRSSRSILETTIKHIKREVDELERLTSLNADLMPEVRDGSALGPTPSDSLLVQDSIPQGGAAGPTLPDPSTLENAGTDRSESTSENGIFGPLHELAEQVVQSFDEEEAQFVAELQSSWREAEPMQLKTAKGFDFDMASSPRSLPDRDGTFGLGRMSGGMASPRRRQLERPSGMTSASNSPRSDGLSPHGAAALLYGSMPSSGLSFMRKGRLSDNAEESANSQSSNEDWHEGRLGISRLSPLVRSPNEQAVP